LQKQQGSHCLAVNAGIDMSMIPYDYENFCKDLIALVLKKEKLRKVG
jgi:hypothetical protein